MAAEKSKHGQYAPQGIVTVTSASDYVVQGKLDFRLARGETLRIISPFNQSLRQEESDFEIAMKRRAEPEGMSLAEIGKKYGLQ
jgi:hypothetical protein